jgi:hypothetical protein
LTHSTSFSQFLNAVFLALWWLIPLASILSFSIGLAFPRFRWSPPAAAVSFGLSPLILLLAFSVASSMNYSRSLFDPDRMVRVLEVTFLWLGPAYLLSALLAAPWLLGGSSTISRRWQVLGLLAPLGLLHFVGAFWIYFAARAQ